MKRLKGLFSMTVVKIVMVVGFSMMMLPDDWKLIAAMAAAVGVGLGLVWPQHQFQRLFNSQSMLAPQPETAPRDFRVAHALLMGILIGTLLGMVIALVTKVYAQTIFPS